MIKLKVKRILNKFLAFFDLEITRIKEPSHYSLKIAEIFYSKYGHGKSFSSGRSIDENESQIPWFTYPAIEYLKQLDLKNKLMLEWGGTGSSSAFFAKRVKGLYSIEHNEEWYKEVLSQEIPNHNLFLADSNYITIADDFNKLFDIICIDGIKRNACVKKSLSIMNKGGLIILDNSDRSPELGSFLRKEGFLQVDFHGFGPINEYTWTTSLFFDRTIELSPISIQPVIPVGGGF
ncbi:hypothetical protein JCM19314_3387 [Nonlabens ulvanivorans]|uniref:Uncharacterized protein n=1 Tax=Nonlabens ulvanivorans TaxID=906888 RepID=A0A090QAU0_NONUL|nr:hypothetical protein [Nonlabens ulvanivorans]GAK99342.1 hypothetical protein JCM19314_3387 [Nonlabens ulvanivorans]